VAEATVIAVLGAESTGKSTLAADLQQALSAEGRRVTQVEEVLREFCDARGRTPRQHEQAGIAAEQTRRIEAAAAGHDIVIADTTAVQIAV
jgi:nicotinamide riboside kinase